ncbi:MAG TPA: sigma-70 family RNA polymerase sigma factor [Thermoanaerobaculia bacterium]|nr:sigma-70 family RNA polymerase sigma factor [Thermoanaerobaculia bacterium]
MKLLPAPTARGKMPFAAETSRRAPVAPAHPFRDAAGGMSTDTGRESDEGEAAAGLARRIAAGDAAAEAQLVARYSRGVFYLLRRLGAPPEVADDLHQETFRIVLERLRRNSLAEPAGLVGFLRGTARNLVLAERRKDFRQRTDKVDPVDLAAAPDPSPSQLHSVLHDEQAALVRRLIGELATDRDRQILLRFYVGEEDKGRICDDLGMDSLHFNRVLFRARQRFKELLQRNARGA